MILNAVRCIPIVNKGHELLEKSLHKLRKGGH